MTPVEVVDQSELGSLKEALDHFTNHNVQLSSCCLWCITFFFNRSVLSTRHHMQSREMICVCRCEISKNLCCRNLAVEKAVSELPTECTFCLKQFPRSSLERHQKEECQDRYSPQKPFLLLPTFNLK